MDKTVFMHLRKRTTNPRNTRGLSLDEARQLFAHIDEMRHTIKTVREGNSRLCEAIYAQGLSMPKTCDTTTTTPCPHCQTGDGGHYPLNPDTIAYGGIEIAMSVHCKHIRARGYPNGTDAPFEGMDVVPINFCPFCGRRL